MPAKSRALPTPDLLTDVRHPMEKYLRMDRLPHIWCSGCGLGTALSCFTYALDELGLTDADLGVVSGIGCTGRAAGYLNLDSYHTTHGRAIAFATGLALARPEKKVVVISGDGDLFAIGGNHFIHAARRNINMTVLCVNNFNYGMTGGQFGPTTPIGQKGTTAPYGNFENPFNLPYLAASSGAVYVARWTSLDARRVKEAMMEAIQRPGFSFVEIISPCPTNYGRRNRIGDGLDELRYYQENTVIRHGSDPKHADLGPGKEITVGCFVDEPRPTYLELYNELVVKKNQF
ncbi:2-oxoacid:ferredoxin oxidoreductase subunit beta [Candidatus Bipolaricaulota bacterium]|nr:2-oxoacid:ferredoxin oxidoreductase subunit beta [Candidatus Bipolaricaulota bacterium]